MAVDVTAEEVARRLSELVGQRAWAPTVGIGSFLTIEFGEPEQGPPEAPPPGAARGQRRQHGAWHLWLYCCAWRLDGPDGMRTASEDSADSLPTGVSGLDGRTVRRAELSDPVGCGLLLEFDDGQRLASFALFAREYEHWHLYCPDGQVVTAGPGTAYSSEPSRGPG